MFIAQVEDYLKEVNKNSSEEKTDDGSPIYPNQHHVNFDVSPGIPGLVNDFSDPGFSSFQPSAFDQQSNDENTPFNAQLMSLGMSEPLPPDDVMEEL
jgi:hypothetical protein